MVKIFEGAHKVEVVDDECPECGTKILKTEFKTGKVPKALDGKEKHRGCIFCDEIFRHG